MSLFDQCKRLNHVAIHVADVSKSVAFYKEVLGLPQMNRPSFSFDGAWFRLGAETELHLIEGRTTTVPSGSRAGHFAIEVYSIVAVEAFLLSKNIPYQPLKRRPDGPFQIFVQDPDGHVFEFTELIFEKI